VTGRRAARMPAGVELRRTWPQRLILAASVGLVLASFSSAAGIAYVDGKVDRLQRVELGGALAPLDGPAEPGRAGGGAGEAGGTGTETDDGADVVRPDALNVLMIGVDSAEGLSEDDARRNDRDDGLRSDTMMLAHLDPGLGLAAIVSFPRDLWLPLGGDGPSDRLNAALPLGGRELLVRTISANFGVEINHLVEVDFAQFERLVDAVGGVPMPFRTPVRDDNSGLYVGEAGCVLMNGRQALAFVRSRFLQTYEDGRWEYDPFSDLSRIRRQQDFVQRALGRAMDRGFRNPVTADRLIDAGLASVTVDDQFAVGDIVSLATAYRGFDPSSLFTFPLPVFEASTGGGSVLVVDEAAAEPILDIFRGRNPDDPAVVHVEVTGTGAAVEAVSSALDAAGFRSVAAGTDGGGGPAAQLRHRAADTYRAELAAAWLDGDVDLVVDESLHGGTVVLDLGSSPVDVRAPADPLPTRWKRPASTEVGVVPGEGAVGCP